MKKSLYLFPENADSIRYKTRKHNIPNETFPLFANPKQNPGELRYKKAKNTIFKQEDTYSHIKNIKKHEFAEILPIAVEKYENKIVKAARTWIDTPFHLHGRVKKVGCDCIGLLMGISRQLAIRSSYCNSLLYQLDRRDYDLLKDAELLSEGLEKHMLQSNDISLGKVLLFKFSKKHQHLGIVSQIISNGVTVNKLPYGEVSEINSRIAIVHACSLVGKVVENFVPNKWLKFVHKVFSLNI